MQTSTIILMLVGIVAVLTALVVVLADAPQGRGPQAEERCHHPRGTPQPDHHRQGRRPGRQPFRPVLNLEFHE